MGVGMHPTRLQIREVLKQSIKNEGCLISSTGYEAAKQRNVVVRNMSGYRCCSMLVKTTLVVKLT